MTSRFCYHIDISRSLQQADFLNVLRNLEEGTILRFPAKWDNNGPYNLSIEACGYLTDDRETKVIKLTNSQRRLLIISAKKGPQFDINIPANEYISKLQRDDFD